MNPELTKKLYDEFPELYRDKDRPQSETCMCWGFTHDDGWFNIIYTLSKVIESLAVNKYAGYDFTTNKPVEVNLYNKGMKAVQVKQKLGVLEFYIGWDQGRQVAANLSEEETRARNRISGAIMMARTLSEITCEVCGQPGKLRQGLGIKTLCESHMKELGYENT